MHTFKDNADHLWSVSINVAAIKRVRGLLNLDLLKLLDGGFEKLGDLVGNPIDLVDLLYCLCVEEAGVHGVTDEGFGRAMAGDALQAAADAFLAEYADFFPDARRRAAIRKVIDAGKTMAERLIDHVTAQLAQIDPEAEARKWIASSGSWPASSESIPDH